MRFNSHRRDASVQFSSYLFAPVIPGHRLERLKVFRGPWANRIGHMPILRNENFGPMHNYRRYKKFHWDQPAVRKRLPPRQPGHEKTRHSCLAGFSERLISQLGAGGFAPVRL